MVSLQQRLARLEGQVMKRGTCPVCKGYRLPEVITLKDGEEPPPVEPCPGCGLQPIRIMVRSFSERPEKPQDADECGGNDIPF